MGLDTHVADSTIAMSIYNLIAFAKRPLSVHEIVAGLGATHFDDIEVRDVSRPLEELARRGWLQAVSDGRLEIVDASERRLIRSRMRGDFVYDADGKPQGGWEGWTSSCDGCDGKLLVEIAKEMAK